MIRILLLLLSLLGPAPLLFARFSLPLPEPTVSPQPETAVPLQDLDAERARVEAHIAEATGQLTQAQQALGAPDPQRTREDEEALQERVNQLQTRIQVGRRHLKVIADAGLVREEKRQLQEEINASARRAGARGRRAAVFGLCLAFPGARGLKFPPTTGTRDGDHTLRRKGGVTL